MFEGLKDKYLNEELGRLRAQTDQIGHSEFAAEIEQRQAFLDLHDQYLQKLEAIQTNAEKELANSRRHNEELVRDNAQKQFELSQARAEIEQIKKYHEVDMRFCSGEIEKLKMLVLSVKGGKDMNLEKELRMEIDTLRAKVEELENELKKAEEAYNSLRSEKNSFIAELVRIKEEKGKRSDHIVSESAQYRSKFEQAERLNRQLEMRLKLAKEQIERMGKELETERSKAIELEDKMYSKNQRLAENFESKIATLDQENRRSGHEIARLTAELKYQQQLLAQKQEPPPLRRQDVGQQTRLPNRQTHTAEHRKPEVRSKSEDPEKESGSKKQESTRQIRIQHAVCDRTTRGHHCRCRYVDRYRSKLGEANEKIMQLLTEKCKMKLELGYLRRTHAELSLMEATADLDNIVIL